MSAQSALKPRRIPLANTDEISASESVSRHFDSLEIIIASGKRLPLSQRATAARVTYIFSANSRCERPLAVRSLFKFSANVICIACLLFSCSLPCKAGKTIQITCQEGVTDWNPSLLEGMIRRIFRLTAKKVCSILIIISILLNKGVSV